MNTINPAIQHAQAVALVEALQSEVSSVESEYDAMLGNLQRTRNSDDLDPYDRGSNLTAALICENSQGDNNALAAYANAVVVNGANVQFNANGSVRLDGLQSTSLQALNNDETQRSRRLYYIRHTDANSGMTGYATDAQGRRLVTTTPPATGASAGNFVQANYEAAELVTRINRLKAALGQARIQEQWWRAETDEHKQARKQQNELTKA